MAKQVEYEGVGEGARRRVEVVGAADVVPSTSPELNATNRGRRVSIHWHAAGAVGMSAPGRPNLFLCKRKPN